MRPFTKLAIVILLLLLAGAALFQILIASGDRPPYPGPVPGTPYPTLTVAP